MTDLEVLPSVAALGDRAAEVFASAVAGAVRRRGRCAFALSRPTPEPVFERIAAATTWSETDLFQVDERVAPDGHGDRNLTLIEHLLSSAPAGMHPMPVGDADLTEAARRYGATLESVCGSPPILDVVHLGIGPDGHTASLVGGDPALEVRDRWVAVTEPYGGRRRMTLTYPVLDSASLVVVVVSGREKSSALAGVLGGDTSLPAARLGAANIVFLSDADAAAELSGA